MPLLIAAATLDPNTAFGLGVWLTNSMGPNAQMVTVPYAWHGVLDPSQPCAADIIAKFLLAFGELTDLSGVTGCLADQPVPDYDGVLAASQQKALESFDSVSGNGGAK